MRRLLSVAFLIPILAPASAMAHCDTLDGPVAAAARDSLEAGAVAPVLPWIKAAGEDEVRAALDRALAARKGGGAAREVADRWYIETVVRVHRAGEGAPFTGLKPAGAVAPAIRAADEAVERGSVDALAAGLARAVEDGVRDRFRHVAQSKGHAAHGLAAARAHVAAYVEFLHYVERLHDAVSVAGHAPEAAARHTHGAEGTR